MHEATLAKALLQQATRMAEDHGGALLEVRVQVGPLAGVEPMLLESAFIQRVADAGGLLPRLVIDPTSLLIQCRDCDTESELAGFDFHCPCCKSRSVRVVRGDELQLVSVTIDMEN